MYFNTNPTHVLIVDYDYGDADNGASIRELNLEYKFEEYPQYSIKDYLDSSIKVLKSLDKRGNIRSQDNKYYENDEDDEYFYSSFIEELSKLYPEINKEWLNEVILWDILGKTLMHDQEAHTLKSVSICPIEYYERLF